MYELTIKFETKEELEKYLAGDKPKAKRTRKPKAKAEAPPVEEIPEDTGPSEEELAAKAKAEEDAKRQERAKFLHEFVRSKITILGEPSNFTSMANDIKTQLDIPLDKKVEDCGLEKLNEFIDELTLSVESAEKRLEREAKQSVEF